jgi:TRAP-type C4-dicarboxylate transport system permease small subunit
MLDQMYQDFTTQILPQLQEGLIITKDYFLDLFGRYITYLIIVDSLLLLTSFITLLFGIYLIKKTWSSIKDEEFIGLVFIVAIIPTCATLLFINSLNNLIKDIYIPEIRVYQQINSLHINHE